jgi:ketosteroid isomerase-like protein
MIISRDWKETGVALGALETSRQMPALSANMNPLLHFAAYILQPRQRKTMKSAILLVYLVSGLIAPAQAPATPQNAAETAIRNADETWAKAVETKSVEQTIACYDSEAMTAGSAMIPAQGLTAIRSMWTNYLSRPGFSLTWKADKILATESSTVAYSTGFWNSGTAAPNPYIAVWRKQPDGKWKVLIDAAWYSRKPEPKALENSGSPTETMIRNLDEALAKAIAAKSVEETVLLYETEAITAGSAMPSAQGIAALREMYQKMFAQPGFTLSLKADKIAIAESKTIAYSSGIWTMLKAAGPYLVIWRKQPGGGWKIVIDSAWYSLPEPAEKAKQ